MKICTERETNEIFHARNASMLWINFSCKNLLTSLAKLNWWTACDYKQTWINSLFLFWNEICISCSSQRLEWADGARLSERRQSKMPVGKKQLCHTFYDTHCLMKSAYHQANFNFKNFPPFFFFHTPARLSLCALVIREGVVNSCSERPFCYTTPLTFMRSCVDLSSNPSIHLPSFPLIWPLVILEGVADRCRVPCGHRTAGRHIFFLKKNIYIYKNI